MESTSQPAATCTPGQLEKLVKSDKPCCPSPIKPKTTRSLGAMRTPLIDQLGRIVKLASPSADKPRNFLREIPFFSFSFMVLNYIGLKKSILQMYRIY